MQLKSVSTRFGKIWGYKVARDLANNSFAHLEQRVYDIRLVRAFKRAQSQAMGDCRFDQLGHRIFRIHVTGSRQPDRLYGFVRCAAQNIAGGHYADGVRALCTVVFKRTVEIGLFVGCTLYGRRGLFYVSRTLESLE